MVGMDWLVREGWEKIRRGCEPLVGLGHCFQETNIGDDFSGRSVVEDSGWTKMEEACHVVLEFVLDSLEVVRWNEEVDLSVEASAYHIALEVLAFIV